jgi:hypothetical protein
MSLTNLVASCGRTKRFEDVNSCLEEMRNLYKQNPEAVAEKLANSFFNAISDYGSAGRFEDVNSCLEEMRNLYKQNPEGVAENISKVSMYVIQTYMEKIGFVPYEIILMAYKFRNCSPLNDKKTQFIENVKKIFFKETLKKVEIEFTFGEKQLENFILFLKSELSDDTELIIVMNSITENLEFRIQNLLWDLIDKNIEF